MRVELVRSTTLDGLRLDGAYAAPDGSAPPTAAFLCVHGTGGHFYGSAVFEGLVERWRRRGVATLRINTRGHDAVSFAATAQGGRRQGAAYERLSDATLDLDAWANWLRERGIERIGLVGHSSGAVKAIWALANQPIPGVDRLIAVSPPRLSHDHFRQSEKGKEFERLYQQANRLVEAGEGHTLLESTFPLPMLITAAGYVEKYGPDAKYDVVKLLPRVAVPSLITYASIEIGNNVAFRGSPEIIASLEGAGQRTVAIIDEANHFYTGKEDALGDVMDGWLGDWPR